ncbi:MAG TPA: peptide chain release factor-like protein [Victivallales bacterium]|nr:peptide chain release factor-like protein [Victivallales bacterium]
MEENYFDKRNKWLISEDISFLKYCKVENYKSTGPGGQKKNKKSSAVRLTHLPTGLTVISDNYREQAVNKKIAVRKLKIKIAINILGPEIELDRTVVSSANDEYPLWIARVFDILKENRYDIREAARILKLTVSKLVKQIYKDKKIWDAINSNRVLNNTYPLNPPK